MSKNFKKRIPTRPSVPRGLVIVLDDSHERVRWLTSILVGIEVRGFERVCDFVAAVNERPENLRLVIFDHDLGRPRPPSGMYDTDYVKLHWDEDGKSGLDAAMEVEPFRVPALIWSHNEDGRKRIALALTREGKSELILESPFREHIDFAAAIGKVMR